jgi:hypothetical protein
MTIQELGRNFIHSSQIVRRGIQSLMIFRSIGSDGRENS